MAKKKLGGRPRTRPKGSPFDRAVGARIESRRKSQGMSHVGLADRIGKHPSQIYRYESGQSSLSIALASEIATALGCKVSDILGEK